ncbi:MAG: hypothetical protein KBB88_01120 [Candidatus Pacebacteria bacterium]|nr:hypothetical protein [Candidatus Paceibacterota bacterium]
MTVFAARNRIKPIAILTGDTFPCSKNSPSTEKKEAIKNVFLLPMCLISVGTVSSKTIAKTASMINKILIVVSEKDVAKYEEFTYAVREMHNVKKKLSM